MGEQELTFPFCCCVTSWIAWIVPLIEERGEEGYYDKARMMFKKKKKEEEAIAKIIYSRNRPQTGCNSGVCDVKSGNLEGMEGNGTNAKRHACCAAPFDKLEKKKRHLGHAHDRDGGG